MVDYTCGLDVQVQREHVDIVVDVELLLRLVRQDQEGVLWSCKIDATALRCKRRNREKRLDHGHNCHTHSKLPT